MLYGLMSSVMAEEGDVYAGNRLKQGSQGEGRNKLGEGMS